MMAIQFNLLPWREEARKKRKKTAIGIFISGALLGMALLGGYFYLKSYELDVAKKNLALIKREINSLQPKLREKKELLALRKKLNLQIDSVESLQANRSSVTHMVEELAKAVDTNNKQVFIESFELKNGDVTISGYAKADTDISRLLISLQQSNWYLIPVVKSIKREKNLGEETKRFEITSKLVLPGNIEEAKNES